MLESLQGSDRAEVEKQARIGHLQGCEEPLINMEVLDNAIEES